MFKQIALSGAFAAQAMAQATTTWPQSCSTPISRLKAGPADYRSILANQTTRWEDADFPVGEIIEWSQYPNNEGDLSSQARQAKNWYYINEKYPSYTMFGVETEQYDIAQGQIGDCYFISGCTSVATYPRRIEDAFATKSMNEVGIYATNVYAMGIPTQITIDGRIPFDRWGSTIFADIGYDGALWGPLIEKAWAKMNGNYEQIVGGWMKEAVNFLNNSPASTLDCVNYSGNEAWTIIDNAFNKSWEVGAETAYNPSGDSSQNQYGLSYSHAYAVIGTNELKDYAGNVQYKLLQIRNPWRSETYTGPWGDSSYLWTEDYKSQVDYIDRDDGVFYMDADSFVSGFESFSLIYSANNQTQGWYYDSDVPDNSWSTYTFTLSETQDLFVDALTWGDRAYPSGCTDLSIFYTKLTKNGRNIGEENYYVQAGFSTIAVESATAGDYTMWVKPQWAAGTVVQKELTVRVTASEVVAVKDSQGNTNQVVWSAHDDSESPYHEPDSKPDTPDTPDEPVTPSEPDTPVTPDEPVTPVDPLIASLNAWTNIALVDYPMSQYSYDGTIYFTQNYIDSTYQNLGILFGSTYNELSLDYQITITADTGSNLVQNSSTYSSCTKQSKWFNDVYSCECRIVAYENYYCNYAVELENWTDSADIQYDYNNINWY